MTTVSHEDEEDHWTAYHEAGHVVAADALGLALKGVSLAEDPRPGGRESIGNTDVGVVRLGDFSGEPGAAMPYMIMAMAGPAAEATRHAVAAAILSGGYGDNEMTRNLALVSLCKHRFSNGEVIVADEEFERNRYRLEAMIAEAARQAVGIVRNNREEIEKVARALIERRTLTGADITDILKAP